MVKPLNALILAAAFSAVSSAAFADDLATFHSKMGGCQVCHGTNAVAADKVPDDELECRFTRFRARPSILLCTRPNFSHQRPILRSNPFSEWPSLAISGEA